MIYIIIPIYNEEQNILNLKNDLNNFLFEDDYTIIFSDDGSIDNTKKEIGIHFSEHKHVVLGDGINRGPGAAFNNGFEYVLSNSVNDQDIIVTIEADCTSDLAILSNMIKLNKMNYSLVLASVYAQGGGFEETSFIRKLISSIANLLFRFVFDVKVLTISSFYALFSLY
jgi:glycosyltransferase involved in cell wall biosynthesis